jgi:hypothetical protein
MDDFPKPDSLARSIRVLAICVGLVAAGLLGLVAMYAFSLYKSRAYFRSATASSSSTRATQSAEPSGSDGKPFHTLSPEQKVKRASAILVTKHQKDGGHIKSIVSEILKRPDSGFHYSVGDEFGELARYGTGDMDYGDGDVVFMVDGSGEQESSTYRNGRISGLGDMPLEILRAVVRGEKGAVSQPGAPSARLDAPPAPPAPAGDHGPTIQLEQTTNGEGVTRTFSIPRNAALSIPEWFPEKGEPPLKMSQAMALATAAASAQSSSHAPFVVRSVRMQLVSCEDPVGNRWYYDFDCVPRQDGGLGMNQSVPVVVLMDGTVVNGVVTKR